MSKSPLMPVATAVWLVENTSLTFDQIAKFCNLHEVEVQGIADGEVAKGIVGYNPIISGQLTKEEIELSSKDNNRHLKLNTNDIELGREVAMHITAINPMVIRSEEISEETIGKEREIYMSQAQDSGKPPEIIEKMVEGRIRKFLSEVSLIDQPFVKEPDRKVGDLLDTSNAEVISFCRLEVGEGIEIEEEDFAAEVAAQLQESQ